VRNNYPKKIHIVNGKMNHHPRASPEFIKPTRRRKERKKPPPKGV
jgi:hypothetical protein